MKKSLFSLLVPPVLRHGAESAAAGLPGLMAAAEKAVAGMVLGDHRQRRAGTGDNFWQFRDYDPTDRPQDIDWRQSAKGDHVFVRQKEWQTTQTILFWVQQDRGMNLTAAKAPRSKHDEAAILGLALALLMTRGGERVAPLAEPGRAGRGEPALLHLGENFCARPEPLPAGPDMPPDIHFPARSGLVLAGDFMQPPERIAALLDRTAVRAPRGLLLQVLDPAEMDLPFPGRVVFRPFGDGGDVPIANVPSIRGAYTERLNAHLQALSGLARQHGYTHIPHIAGGDLRATLSACWQALAPQPRLGVGG